MKTYNSLLMVSCLALVLFACGTPSAIAADATKKKPAKEAPAVPPGPQANLKQGMSAEEVQKIMGKPEATKPMTAPSGKAEVWIYRRQIDTRAAHVPIGSTPVMMDVEDNNHNIRKIMVGETIQYRDIDYVTDEISELLMYNDHFLTLKTSTVESKKFR